MIEGEVNGRKLIGHEKREELMSGARNLNQLIIINYLINKYKVMGKFQFQFQLVVKFFSPSFKFEAVSTLT